LSSLEIFYALALGNNVVSRLRPHRAPLGHAKGVYPLLCEDLASLTPDRSVPVVLIKANVCRILEPLLTGDGFQVLNNGNAIYFPSHGQQTKFRSQFADALNGSAS
jgi:hypothetical protein